ncbi:MAG TPA: hypothetical protein VF582_03580 [Allosphingosinicella sp.]|jgi:hypothetical protein
MMWRRGYGRYGRRSVGSGRRSMVPYSFAGTVLLVSLAALLLLYFMGYIG